MQLEMPEAQHILQTFLSVDLLYLNFRKYLSVFSHEELLIKLQRIIINLSIVQGIGNWLEQLYWCDRKRTSRGKRDYLKIVKIVHLLWKLCAGHHRNELLQTAFQEGPGKAQGQKIFLCFNIQLDKFRKCLTDEW